MELISSLTPGRFFCDLESKIRPAFVKNNAGLIFGCSLKDYTYAIYSRKFLSFRIFAGSFIFL